AGAAEAEDQRQDDDEKEGPGDPSQPGIRPAHLAALYPGSGRIQRVLTIRISVVAHGILLATVVCSNNPRTGGAVPGGEGRRASREGGKALRKGRRGQPDGAARLPESRGGDPRPVRYGAAVRARSSAG